MLMLISCYSTPRDHLETGLGLVDPGFEGPALPKELRQQSRTSQDAERVQNPLRRKELEKPAHPLRDTSRIQTPLRPKTLRIDKDQSGSNQPSPVRSYFG